MAKKIFISLSAGIVVFGFSNLSFAAGCGTHASHGQMAQAEHSGHSHMEAESTPPAAAKEAMNVGNKICPVSGEKIGEGGMQAATYEYEGKIYNFCCPACIEEFKKDPEKYIKKIEEEKAKTTAPQEHPHSH